MLFNLGIEKKPDGGDMRSSSAGIPRDSRYPSATGEQPCNHFPHGAAALVWFMIAQAENMASENCRMIWSDPEASGRMPSAGSPEKESVQLGVDFPDTSQWIVGDASADAIR